MGRVKEYLEDLSSRGFGGTDDRAVCLDCIIDQGLREQTALILTEPACSFCGREAADDTAIAADFAEFMRLIMDAIGFFYERSIDSLWASDDVTTRYPSSDVAENVCSGAVSDDVLEAVTEVIDPQDWNDDPAALRPDAALRRAWEAFTTLVKYESRFVFLAVPEEHSDHPDEFTISEILAKLVEIIQSRGAIVEVPAGRQFWRGRMTDEPEKVPRSAASLGSPPREVASTNRMSPAGISMFYGCDDIETVVAEIGAHSPKRFAVLGKFTSSRPLQLVDLSNLPPIPSVFDPIRREGYYELCFLHEFAKDLSARVIMDGREHIDYVPTQVVTEYLRWLPDPKVDGILFASAQNGGTCCVLFCGPGDCADDSDSESPATLRFTRGSGTTTNVVSTPYETMIDSDGP